MLLGTVFATLGIIFFFNTYLWWCVYRFFVPSQEIGYLPCFHSIVWATAPAAPQLCLPNQKSRGTDRHTMGRLQQSGLEFDLENPIDRYKYLAKYRNILSRWVCVRTAKNSSSVHLDNLFILLNSGNLLHSSESVAYFFWWVVYFFSSLDRWYNINKSWNSTY